jgi:hypothetical protein
MDELIVLLILLLIACCLFIITFWHESCLKKMFDPDHILYELSDYP